MLHSTCLEIDEMEMLKNKNHELEEQINKMKRDFLLLKTKIFETDSLIEQLRKNKQENTQIQNDKKKLLMHLKSQQVEFDKLRSEHTALLMESLPVKKRNEELTKECEVLKLENESNKMIIKQLNASQSLSKDEILKLKAEIASLNKKPKCADKNATLVSSSSSKKPKSVEPEDELSDSDASMVDVECVKFSKGRLSTPSKLSFSNDTQSKQCEEITSSGFKASLSNIFSQGLTSQQTSNACIDGKDKGTSNESYALRNKKVKKPSQKNGKNKNSSAKKKKEEEELAEMAKNLEMALCSDNKDSEASCDRTENKDISSRSPLSSPQKLLRSKTFNVTNNKNRDLRKNQGNKSKKHHTKKLAKDLLTSSDDDEDDFEEVIDVSDKMAGSAKREETTLPQEKSDAGRKCESGQLHESSHKYPKKSVEKMQLSSDEEDDDDFEDVIDMNVTQMTIMATSGATEQNNLPIEISNFNKNCAIKSSQAVEYTFKHSKELHLSSDEDDDLEKLTNDIAGDLVGVTPVDNPARGKESLFKDTEATNVIEENDKNLSNASPMITKDGSFVSEEQMDGDPDEGSVCTDSADKSQVYNEMMKELEMSSDEDDEQDKSKIATERKVEAEDKHLQDQEDVVQSLVKPNDSHPVIEGDQEVDDELSVNDVLTNAPIDVPTEIQIERPSNQSTMQHVPRKLGEHCAIISVAGGNTECFTNGEKLIDEPVLTSCEEEELSKDTSKGTVDDINVDNLEDQFIVASNDDIDTISENEDAKEVEAVSSCLPSHPISSDKDELSIDTANNNEAMVRSSPTEGCFEVTDMECVRIEMDDIAESLDVNPNEEAITTEDVNFISEEQMDGDPDEGSVCTDSADKSQVYNEMMKELEMSSDEDDEQKTTETMTLLIETEVEPLHVESDVQPLIKPNDSLPVIEGEPEVDDQSFVIDAPIEIQIERPSLPIKEAPPNNSHKVVRNDIAGNKDSEEETVGGMSSFDASSRSAENKVLGFERRKRENVTNHKVLNGASNKKLKKDEYAQRLMEDLFSSPCATKDSALAALNSSCNENILSQTTTRLLAEKTLGKKFEENMEKKTPLPKVDKMHVCDELQISSDSSDDEKDDKSEEMEKIKKNVKHKETVEDKKVRSEDPQQNILREALSKPQKDASSKLLQETSSKLLQETSSKLLQETSSRPQKKTSSNLQRQAATNLQKELWTKNIKKEASSMLEKETANKLQIEDSSKPQKKISIKIEKEAECKPTIKRKRSQSPELVTNAKKLKIDSNEMPLGNNKERPTQTKPNGNDGKKEIQKAVKVVNARCKKDEKTFDDFQKLSPDDLSSLVELPRIHSPLKVPVVPVVPVVSVVPDKVESDKQRRCFVTSMIKAAMSSKDNPRNGWITKWKKKENSLVNPWVPPFILSIIDYIKDTAENHNDQEHQFIDCFLTESICRIVKLKGNVKEKSVVSLCCVAVAMMRIQG